jgi:1-acyl-sn-glycerol-3-phosphate acyltransferase
VQAWKLKPAQDLGMPLGQSFVSLRRESGLVHTAAHLVWWALVRGYLRFCHRLEICGDHGLPREPPFILVSNHTSHLDTLVLASQLPWRLRDRIFPIAAGDTFFETPVRAALAAGLLNALPMWRGKCGRHALEELRNRLLAEPCAYILFPEGTRSRDGKTASFKSGLGMLIAGTNVPVVPCSIAGAFQALPPHRVWPRFRQITLRVGEPLIFSSVKNDSEGWKEISQATEAAVRRLKAVLQGRQVLRRAAITRQGCQLHSLVLRFYLLLALNILLR